MVPQEKLAAVNRGLTEAFGVTEIEDIRKMTKGHAYALVLRVVVRGNPYLLRVILRPNAAIGPDGHLRAQVRIVPDEDVQDVTGSDAVIRSVGRSRGRQGLRARKRIRASRQYQ